MHWKKDLQRSLTIAWPVIIGQLSYIALGVIDSMMVGRLGATPLAAAALSNSYFALPLTFCFGLAAGIAPLAAKLYAQRDQEELSGLHRNGLWATLGSSLFAALLMVLFIFILPYLGQPEDVVLTAEPYILLLAGSLIPQTLFLSYKNFTEGLEWMKPALYVGILSVPVNAVLNYLLIFGPWIFPEWGLMGAGVATLITRWLMLFAIHQLMRMSELRAYIDFRWKANRKTIKTILNIGVPAGIQYVFETGAFAIAALFMGMLGTLELAAHQIAINLASIPFMVCIGLSAAGAIRMGNAYGNNNWPLIRQSGQILLLVTVGFMLCSALIITLLKDFLPSLYISDVRVIEYAAQMLIIAALFQLSDGVQAVSLGLLRGLEDVRKPTLFTLVAYWVIAIPLGYYLAFYADMGYMGIWIGLLIGLTLSALMLLGRFYALSRRMIKSES